MRQLHDSIHIDARPEQVWFWLSRLAEHYAEWHPDHVSATWVNGEPNQVGSLLRAVEYLGGKREELVFEMSTVEPPHRMLYRIKGAHSLLLPGGSFEIDPDDGGSRFTARISYRFGRVTERLLETRVTGLRKHMREEGQNLKRLLEAEAEPADHDLVGQHS